MVQGLKQCRCQLRQGEQASRSKFKIQNSKIPVQRSMVYVNSRRATINERKLTMAEKIGFVGVGRMGSNMARRLKESGYEIAAVYDVNTAGAQTLAQELGCQAPGELKQVTKLSDVIITVVTDDKAMKNIYNGGL